MLDGMLCIYPHTVYSWLKHNNRWGIHKKSQTPHNYRHIIRNWTLLQNTISRQ